ncbi:hypothetical protein [Nonomuraea rosea]
MAGQIVVGVDGSAAAAVEGAAARRRLGVRAAVEPQFGGERP